MRRIKVSDSGAIERVDSPGESTKWEQSPLHHPGQQTRGLEQSGYRVDRHHLSSTHVAAHELSFTRTSISASYLGCLKTTPALLLL